MNRFASLAFGAIFGWVLGWTRATDYNEIHAMLKLTDLHLFLVMGSAMATAFVGITVLRSTQARSLLNGEPISVRRLEPKPVHIVGSILFGIGWAVAGTCPGPVAAQVGRGQWAGLFTMAGLIGGIWLARRGRLLASHEPTGECAPVAVVAGL